MPTVPYQLSYHIVDVGPVSPGDNILVQEAGAGATYKGVVHEVRSEQIFVNFHPSFQAIGRRYNVCFQLNRTTLRRQHQALCASIPNSARLLFPERGDECLDAPVSLQNAQLALFNSSVGTNAGQLQAIQSILQIRPRSAPFILVGP